jgi:hypothetical protein
MEIHEVQHADGNVTYDVTLQERDLEHLQRLQKHGRVDEKPFEAVAAFSELTERAYSLLVRPFVREAVPDWLGAVMRDLHPLRMERWALSDRNPLMAPLPYLASAVHGARRPRNEDSVPVALERFASKSMTAALDLYRDVRDASAEAAFYFVYGNMLSLSMADEDRALRRRTRFDPRALPAVRQVLETLDQGSRLDGLARIALLVTRAGDKHKLPYIERVRDILDRETDAGALSEDERRRLWQEETIIVEFEPLRAKRALPKLLGSAPDRRAARGMLDSIEAHVPLNARQQDLVGELRTLLPLPALRQAGKGAPVARPAKAAKTTKPAKPAKPAKATKAAAARGVSRKRVAATPQADAKVAAPQRRAGGPEGRKAAGRRGG